MDAGRSRDEIGRFDGTRAELRRLSAASARDVRLLWRLDDLRPNVGSIVGSANEDWRSVASAPVTWMVCRLLLRLKGHIAMALWGHEPRDKWDQLSLSVQCRDSLTELMEDGKES